MSKTNYENRVINETSLEKLEVKILRDFALINHPVKNWNPHKLGPDGKPLIDVLIVGGGMNGLAASLALRLAGIANIRHVDSQPKGLSGPWLNYARMHLLRSPKNLVGPAQNIPNLTFRAWWEAKYSPLSWESFEYIERPVWAEYLIWFEKISNANVEFGTKVTNIDTLLLKKNATDSPQDFNITANLTRTNDTLGSKVQNNSETVYARHLVLATGREGLAQKRIPKVFMDSSFSKMIKHSSEDVDYTSLAGKSVAVIGLGASAFDNAAAAAESGATVTLIGRAPSVPLLNKMKQTVYPGFSEGFSKLANNEKINWLLHVFKNRVAPPKQTVNRVAKLNIKLMTGAQTEEVHLIEKQLHLGIKENGDPNLTRLIFDHVIVAAGFKINLSMTRELSSFWQDIKIWRDVFSIQDRTDSDWDAEILDFPYLGEGFEFQSRSNKNNPLKYIHCFNHAAQISLGNLANDIPHSGVGAQRLARSITSQLFLDDREYHFSQLKEYDSPEITGEEWDQIK
ncbi:MAG: cation diffusion facilitator CzcD-associated flavoprotein CzcO [Paracoccaceae bacterium]|jgi:cation diffusion facilitator CzcD-associated flavoprotein CzcO